MKGDRPIDPYSVNTIGGPTDPNRQIFTSSIAAHVEGSGLNSWSHMTVAPVATGCNVSYSTVTQFSDECESVRKGVFASFSKRLEFSPHISLYANETGEAAPYLMPTPEKTCVAIKQQFLY